MKILVFAASNSSQSINKKLVSSISKYYKEPEDIIEIIDLNDYEIPLYSYDRQLQDGIPKLALDFSDKVDWADFILISFAEHNGNYSAAYKNILDWVSRIKGRKPYPNKPMFLIATSNGSRGGQSVLDIATNRMPFDGGIVLETFSLPDFNNNFEEGKGVINMLYRSKLEAKVRKTKRELAKIQTEKN
ncbi:NAD(P)H-dependent oxidoreductase [Sphingobacterium alkalisoli]|uniref:NAD(P)H-dependent oxidoreductase n=1 Tax=Sphingobacterium alkalisoli TaxID=1874115 RepID=A0A4U0H1W4_9SPHI|nr:NAD(P)H-dependent oxidoreductase [Sphingobacterium alkalisoli]TJY65550.1 NAD(P)H-dependent oxidoreductase [Sphingobacterium alkalisoli]GGH19790.1 FMN reductase [Sphingobacterium alkalisoli]